MSKKGLDTETTIHSLNQVCCGDINESGTYIANWSGHLLRIPEDAVKQGRSPVIELLGKEPMVVTKLSDDPFLTISKARM